MLFLRSFLIAAVATPLFAFAQTDATGPNPFTLTNAFTATAGEDAQLKWTPTTDGTVTLILRQGSTGDLDTVQTIASGIPNSGSYTWSVPESAVRGSDYTIEIVSDSNPDDTNYSGRFILESDNVAAPTSSSTSSVSSTSVSLTSTSATSTTSSSSSTSSQTSTTSDAQTTTTDSSDLQQTPSPSNTDNAAPRATAMVGLLGAVALGALAL